MIMNGMRLGFGKGSWTIQGLIPTFPRRDSNRVLLNATCTTTYFMACSWLCTALVMRNAYKIVVEKPEG
jgi:hypothetical protein